MTARRWPVWANLMHEADHLAAALAGLKQALARLVEC
jgi:hypothetical protein